MVYSSIPTYLDPSNWQQQPNDQSRGSGSSDQLNHQLVVSIAQSVPPPQPPPPPHEPQPHVAGGCMGGSIRPGSMAERARLANIPLPEAPLKCPRCESTNTKFCYFNNYSLTQPRHFCKTCKRYWTRGGALRSVPVGGGCRRNKRSKAGGGANSKSSPAATSSDHRQTPCSSTSTVSSNSTGPGNLLGLMPPQIPALRFLSPLGQLSSDHYNSGLSSPLMGFCEPNFQTNSLSGFDGGGGLGSLGGSIEQWRLQNLQQFPFLGGGGGGGGLDSSTAGLHQFQGSIIEPTSLIGQTSPNHVRPEVSSSILTQMAAIKMEENQGLNLSRQMIMGISRNDPWTGTTAWNDFTTFSSSSTSNPL